MDENNAIGIRFGVEGGSSVDGATGKLIKQQLRGLFNNLNKDGSNYGIKVNISVQAEDIKAQIESALKQIPTAQPITLELNTQKITEQITALKTELSQIVSDAFTIGKNSKIDTKSIKKSQEAIQEALGRDFTIVVKADVSQVTQAIQQIKTELQAIATDFPFVDKLGDISKASSNASNKQLQEQKRIIDNYYNAVKRAQAESTRTDALSFTRNKDNSYSVNAAIDTQYVKDQIAAQTNLNKQTEIEANLRKQIVTDFQQAKAAYDALIADAKANNKTDVLNYNAEAEAKAIDKMEAKLRSAQNTWDKLKAKANEYIDRIEFSASRDSNAVNLISEVRNFANNPNQDQFQNYDKLLSKFNELRNYIEKNGLAVKDFGQQVTSQFNSKIVLAFAGVIGKVLLPALKQIVPNVVDINTAMTQLNIVVNANRQALTEYSKSIEQAAARVGASMKSLIISTTTFARLGYSLEEASKLAELTAAYAKVSDTNVSEATTALTTIIKAFGVQTDELEGLIDKLMYVGQSFPISASEIGVGFANAGSALQAAGNTINQSIALLTAANTQIQDINKASTAMRTIVARINRAEADLSELGESIEDVATTAKLQEFMSAFGVNVEINGELRTTYDILKDLADVWDDLTGEQRASIAEKLAGTRQQSIFFGLMNSFKREAVSVMETIDNAEGTLAEATAKRVDSIQGRLDQLTAAWEAFSTRVLNSDLVKNGLKVLVDAVNFLNTDNNAMRGAINWAATTAAIIALTSLLKGSFIQNLVQKVVTPFSNILTFIRGREMSHFSKQLNSFKTSAEEAVKAQTKWFETAKKYEAGGGDAAASQGKATLIMTLIAAVVSALVVVLKQLDKAWQQSYESASRAASEAQKNIDQYDDEINRLQTLQDKLAAAKGDRVELAKIYDDLNSEIEVSNKLLTGEAAAYNKTNVELQAQIAYRKELRQIAQREKITASQNAADAYRLTRSGAFGWDAAATDLTSAEVRNLLSPRSSAQKYNALKRTYSEIDDYGLSETNMTAADILYALQDFRLENKGSLFTSILDPKLLAELFDYDSISEMNSDQQALFFQMLGVKDSDFWEYLTTRVDYYKDILEIAINDFQSSVFGNDSFADYITDYVIRRGGDANDVIKLLNNIGEADDALAASASHYVDLMHDVTRSEKERNEASAIMIQDANTLIETYPFLEERINAYVKAVSETASVIKEHNVEAKELLDILKETQSVYDTLSSAISQGGILDAKTLSSILELEKDLLNNGIKLSDILVETEQGYKMNANALSLYVGNLINAYQSEAKIASAKTLPTALENLRKLRIVLATLLYTQVKEQDQKKQQQALENEKNAINEQLDAYQELINLRKELLKTYKDEVDYQKELAKKQKTVADLQAQLAVARLDQTASGRARARDIAAQLKTAQDDLDKFNLEHAVEVLTNDLDDQYDEYKKYMNSLLKDIEKKIDELKDTVADEVDFSWVEDAMRKIDLILRAFENNSNTSTSNNKYQEVNIDERSSIIRPSTGSSGGTTISLTNGLVPPSKRQERILEDTVSSTTSGSAYNSRYYKEVINRISNSNMTPVSLIFSQGFDTLWQSMPSEERAELTERLRQRTYDPEFLASWRKALMDTPASSLQQIRQKAVSLGIDPSVFLPDHYARSYHTGGFVGSTTKRASTSEVFAKLMTGEYVATPAMIQNFMEQTLPRISNIESARSNTTFNAPLITIECDNVTSEAMPQIKVVVNEAVKEIKKQLDGGMSRQGRMTEVRRLTI